MKHEMEHFLFEYSCLHLISHLDIASFPKLFAKVKDEQLLGHKRSVTCLQVHSSVLISGSNEGTVRLWTIGPSGSFQCHGQPLTNPSGGATFDYTPED